MRIISFSILMAFLIFLGSSMVEAKDGASASDICMEDFFYLTSPEAVRAGNSEKVKSYRVERVSYHLSGFNSSETELLVDVLESLNRATGLSEIEAAPTKASVNLFILSLGIDTNETKKQAWRFLNSKGYSIDRLDKFVTEIDTMQSILVENDLADDFSVKSSLVIVRHAHFDRFPESVAEAALTLAYGPTNFSAYLPYIVPKGSFNIKGKGAQFLKEFYSNVSHAGCTPPN